MPLEVFYSYSHKDAELRDKLDVHLAQLVHDGLIVPWADRRIAPGDEWRNQIDAHVRSAHIILLLVSPEFLASEYCYGIEMKISLERHAKGEAVVIPIILRPCDWHSAPFAELQALPRDGKAVTLWANRDVAFAQIAQEIRAIVTRFQDPQPVPVQPVLLHDRQVPKARVVDAAMPDHIVKARATELLVLVRLPESKGLAGILQEDDEAEARPQDVRSKPFEVVFPLGLTGSPEPLKIAVQVTSPDFSPPSQIKNIFVPVNGDSEVCAFLLTPQRTGPLLVVIELVWQDVGRGYRRLKTTCIADSELPAAKPALSLVRMEVGVKPEAVARLIPNAPASITTKLHRIRSPRVHLDYDVEAAAPAPAAPSMPPPVFSARSSRKPGFLATPFAKVGLAICLLGVGSSVFFWQQAPTAVAPEDAQTISTQLKQASADFEQLSKSSENTTPAIEAAIRETQTSVIAARTALAKRDYAAAKKHLEKVQQMNNNLRQMRKEPPKPKNTHKPAPKTE